VGEPKGQRRVGTVRRFPVIILEHLEPASRSPARGAAAAFRTRHTSTTLTLDTDPSRVGGHHRSSAATTELVGSIQ